MSAVSHGTAAPGTSQDAVVLCAGEGKRLAPLTEHAPKVLVEVAGTPLLAYHLEALRASGFRRATLVVGYKAEAVRAFVESRGNFGLDVRFCLQSRTLGTGDAVLRAMPFVGSELFLVTYADTYSPSLPRLFRSISGTLGPVIVAARVEDASEYGRLSSATVEGTAYLTNISEKDGQHSPGLVNAGIYLLPLSIEKELHSGQPSSRGELELTDSLVRAISAGTRFRVVEIDDWVDVGTPQRLQRAEQLKARSSTTVH